MTLYAGSQVMLRRIVNDGLNTATSVSFYHSQDSGRTWRVRDQIAPATNFTTMADKVGVILASVGIRASLSLVHFLITYQ